MEKIRDLWYKRVRIVDEDYTIGGIVVTFVGLVGFMVICGFVEAL